MAAHSSNYDGAGGIPAYSLQQFEAYCANTALVPSLISRGAPRQTGCARSISEATFPQINIEFPI
jgi:hypothetical protein